MRYSLPHLLIIPLLFCSSACLSTTEDTHQLISSAFLYSSAHRLTSHLGIFTSSSAHHFSTLCSSAHLSKRYSSAPRIFCCQPFCSPAHLIICSPLNCSLLIFSPLLCSPTHLCLSSSALLLNAHC